MLRCITVPHCPCSYKNKALFVIDQWATGACVSLSTVRYIVGFTDHPRSNMLSAVCTDLVLDHAFVSFNFLNVPCAHTCMHHPSFQLIISVLWYIYIYKIKNIDLKFAIHSYIFLLNIFSSRLSFWTFSSACWFSMHLTLLSAVSALRVTGKNLFSFCFFASVLSLWFQVKIM